MFGSRKTEANKVNLPQSVNPNAINSLVAGTVVEGTVNAESDFRVDGKILGKLNCNAKLIIGPSGTVDGEVKCVNAVIEGTFIGKLVVSDMLVVKESAVVQGDITTGKLSVSAGATFNVVCDMKSSLPEHLKSIKSNSLPNNGAVKQEQKSHN
ncbi:MAG: polymer-forming cytoskeletal protein [Saprospiraceae bacterium]|nr:polymer-forming cytoskeletal protein [Saprospiraceae bacterium]